MATTHESYKIEEFTISNNQTKWLEPGIYQVTCYGNSMPNTFHDGEAILSNWSSVASRGGMVKAEINLKAGKYVLAKESPGGSAGSNGYDGSSSTANYWYYHSSPGFKGGSGIGFYILGASADPIICAGGAGGIGGECYGTSHYTRYGTSHSSYANNHTFSLSGPKGGNANSNGGDGTYSKGGSANGSGGIGPSYSEVQDSTAIRYTASGGGGGGGWPAGGGGSESSTKGYHSSNYSTVHSSYKGYDGGSKRNLTYDLTINGITYSINYQSGGDGSRCVGRVSSQTYGNSDGGGGAGGCNYVNTSLATQISSTLNSVTTAAPYVKIERFITYNGIIVNGYKCTLECSEEEKILGGEVMNIYVSNVEHGYTVDSVTITAPGYYNTIAIDPEEHLQNNGVYEIPITLPNLQDVDFEISNTVKVNPYITTERNNTWSIMPSICTVQGERYYYDISGDTPLLKPDINSYIWVNNVFMRNGWKFKECTLTVEGENEVRFLQVNDKVLIKPEWEGKHITIKVYEQEDQIPFYFTYCLHNIYENVYEEAYTRIIYGQQPGQLLVYRVEQPNGYHYTGDPVLSVYLGEHGSALDLYFEPNEYNLIVLSGESTSSSLGKALYTEPVSVKFLRNKYQGDPLDEFVHWKSEEGLEITGGETSDTFPMPPHDLRIYPVMRPYRKNSNVYRNKYPVDDVYGNYIYHGYRRNLENDGDIVQVNHGFKVGDVIYHDETDNLYKLALADGSEKSIVVGIVHNVNMYDVFGYQMEGPTDIKYEWDETRSSIMFLSDTIPGKLVPYEDIENGIYIPVGLWTKYGIIMDIGQPTDGIYYEPYQHGDLGPDGDDYTDEEIEETIEIIKNNMARR